MTLRNVRAWYRINGHPHIGVYSVPVDEFNKYELTALASQIAAHHHVEDDAVQIIRRQTLR